MQTDQASGEIIGFDFLHFINELFHRFRLAVGSAVTFSDERMGINDFKLIRRKHFAAPLSLPDGSTYHRGICSFFLLAGNIIIFRFLNGSVIGIVADFSIQTFEEAVQVDAAADG